MNIEQSSFITTDHNLREPEFIVMDLTEVFAELVADDDHNDVSNDGVGRTDNITGHCTPLTHNIVLLLAI